MTKIGVIIGTTRPTRKGPLVAKWVMAKIKKLDIKNVNFELIDVQKENLPFLMDPKSPADGEYELESTKKWSKKIDACDGFIFITAEYNNGPAAPLKNAIDTIYREWDRKPVAFVGYGTYGATRAVEQLVDIAAKIGMAPLSKTFVGISKFWDAVDDEGNIKEEYVSGNVEKLVDNLLWWTKALKHKK